MIVRTYRRRSKNDEGKQQFSLDVQLKGCEEHIARMDYADAERVDYVDDGRAGDDFLGRTGLRQLLADAKRGDVIVCRDQSRLGRDALEVTIVVRDLVRDRGCRLFYYANGHEVMFANAIDQATTFIQGTGHQMELEAIRSRTREGLRSRVRAGRIAGGSCFGYTLERKSDGSGRRFTIAVVNDSEAPVVERIYREYLAGRGLKQIAHQLNHEGVPAPSAGRRGSGSWAPSAVRTILLNQRYRGVYVHGRIKKVRQAGGVVRMKAEPSEMLVVEIPEWRVIDDATWFAVNAKFTTRGPNPKRPAAKYALTGIAKCGSCGGAVGAARVRAFGGATERVLCYGCAKHHERGSSVCPVTVHQPMADVEAALIEYLQHHVLTDQVLEIVISEVRSEIAAQLPKREADTAALEADLVAARAEQKRLAQAVALASDVPEIVTELKKRSNRIAHLEAEILAAKRTPDDLAALITRTEAGARYRLHDLRNALAEQRDLREVFLALFPQGLRFTPARTPTGDRQVWQIEGAANLATLLGDGGPDFGCLLKGRQSGPESGPDCVATPTGRVAIGRTRGSFRAVGDAAVEEPPRAVLDKRAWIARARSVHHLPDFQREILGPNAPAARTRVMQAKRRKSSAISCRRFHRVCLARAGYLARSARGTIASLSFASASRLRLSTISG